MRYNEHVSVPDGLGVRIPGFHPGGPGSIPGLGVFYPKKIAKVHSLLTYFYPIRYSTHCYLVKLRAWIMILTFLLLLVEI